MNGLIRRLQREAFDFVAKQNMTKKEYFWENVRHNRDLQHRIDEKFAELIIQECLQVVKNKIDHGAAYEYGMNDEQRAKVDCAVDIADELKECFGVEE